MKRILLSLILVFISILILIILARGSFKIWKTVCFSSIPREEAPDGDVKKLEKLIETYPDLYINNAFLDVCTNATNETVFFGENPYRIVFRFWSLGTEKSFCIKSIEILNEDLSYSYIESNFESRIQRSKVVNGKNYEESKSDLALGIFSTTYDFDLKEYKKDIKLKLICSIDGVENESIIVLKRYERKGFIKWGY